MSRRTATRVILWLLALIGLGVGAWAQVAPHSFWRDFPGFGHDWRPPLGPYNEHAFRDFGGLNLALAAVTAVAAVTMTRATVAAAALGWESYSLPHLAFHLDHLAPYGAVDGVLNVVALAATVLLPLAAYALSSGAPTAIPGSTAGAADRNLFVT